MAKMLTANVSSAMVVQNLNGVLDPSPRSFHWTPSSCLGPFCTYPEDAHKNADVSNKNLSRRVTVASFLQVALFCSPCTTAQAAAAPRMQNANNFECMPMEKWLVMHGSSDLRGTPGSSSKRNIRKKAGFVLAYQGQQTPSDSSLGLLGCIIFGLLFLKERLSRTASDASLEDVQQRLKKVDKELCLQTRNSVTSEVGASKLADNNGMDWGPNEALLRQLVNARSNLIEVGEQLDKSRGMSESLKRQVSSLEALIREMKRECGLLGEKIDEQLKARHGLEEALQSIKTDLQVEADEVGSLRAGLEGQEEAYRGSSDKLVLVENLLGKAIEVADQAENKANNVGIALFASHGREEFLAEKLKATMARNEALEKEINGATERMREEGAAALASLTELKEHLEVKGRESEAVSAELMKKWDDLRSHKMKVSQLINDRDELWKVSKEKQSRIDGLLELSNSAEKSFAISKNELADLHVCLHDERARSMALERGHDLARGQFVMVSSELESLITTEKELIAKLENELRDVHGRALVSIVDVSTLQKTMEASSASQVHLQEQLGVLHEAKQAYMVALRKEKRAAAYAKKKLASCEEVLAGENGELEELRAGLEQERMRMRDLKVQVLSRTAELDKAMETSAHSADDASSLKADKQALGKGSDDSDKDRALAQTKHIQADETQARCETMNVDDNQKGYSEAASMRVRCTRIVQSSLRS